MSQFECINTFNITVSKSGADSLKILKLIGDALK